MLAYARRRIRAGASVTAVGSEVGLSAVTLARWLRGAGSGAGGFLPVDVEVEAAPARGEVGYNRAADLIERMEREGVIGPANGIKPREVLIKPVGEARI